MKNRIVFLSLLLAASASAKDFDARVADAKTAEQTPTGAKYQESLGPPVEAAMEACVPAGSSATANLGTFVLVGDVKDKGQLTNVAVEPATAVSRCFSAKFQTTALPAPPIAPGSASTYPIEIEMRVDP